MIREGGRPAAGDEEEPTAGDGEEPTAGDEEEPEVGYRGQPGAGGWAVSGGRDRRNCFVDKVYSVENWLSVLWSSTAAALI